MQWKKEHGRSGQDAQRQPRREGFAQIQEFDVETGHQPACGQGPLQGGSRDDGPGGPNESVSFIQGEEDSSADRNEKEQLDGNASAEPIEGPEVGVAKFGQGTKHHSGEQDLDHGSGTRKTVTQKQPGHPLSLEHQG